MIDEGALVGLAATLLGTLVVSTWRFASLATKLTQTIVTLEEKVERVEHGLTALEEVPRLHLRVSMLEKLLDSYPSMLATIETIKLQLQHSRELRAVQQKQIERIERSSRPDPDEV